MRTQIINSLTYAALGFLAGALVVGLMSLALVFTLSNTVEVEVEVPTIICPPIVEAAGGFRLFFETNGQGAVGIPAFTDLDIEFAEKCGLEWADPVRVVPPAPEDGGA